MVVQHLAACGQFSCGAQHFSFLNCSSLCAHIFFWCNACMCIAKLLCECLTHMEVRDYSSDFISRCWRRDLLFSFALRALTNNHLCCRPCSRFEIRERTHFHIMLLRIFKSIGSGVEATLVWTPHFTSVMLLSSLCTRTCLFCCCNDKQSLQYKMWGAHSRGEDSYLPPSISGLVEMEHQQLPSISRTITSGADYGYEISGHNPGNGKEKFRFVLCIAA